MLRKALRTLAIACIWLCLWAVASAYIGQTLLLPSPLETLSALLQLAQSGAFWLAAIRSILRIVAGFALGIVLGALLAVLTSRFDWWRHFFGPFLSIVKATPVASFIVLALVWIKTDGVPIFAAFLIVLPVAHANITEGVTGADKTLLEMARAFGMPKKDMITKIYWPTVRPYLRAAVTSGMGMAWKAGVAAEVICTPREALGTWLYNAKVYLDMPRLFATTAVVILLSILLEKLVVHLAGGHERGRAHA